MPRTTVNIDGPILKEVKALRKGQRRSLGRVTSELLAEARALRRGGRRRSEPALRWFSQRMEARVDLDDKDAVYGAMDRDD